jgi:putative hydrolase of the HAD superfamily
MVARLTSIGLDADDTLWHNETFFRLTQEHFADLHADHAERDQLHTRLLDVERRNLGHYGFGIKGFMLSMIETAIEVTEDRVPASVIREILSAGQEMLHHPIALLPHAGDVVERLASSHRLIVITKCDLLDQERKLAQSGLGDLLQAVEIVSDRTCAVYARVFARHGDGPDRAMMAGNSMKSDVRPALEAGAWGDVPHGLTWAAEHATVPAGHPRFREIPDLGALPDLLDALDG